MPVQIRYLAITALMLGALGAMGADYAPDFDPDYRPVPSSDEGGLWYRVDKLEADVRNSPHRVRDTELNDYLAAMVCALAGDFCSSIRVYLIDNPHFNASMAPNGMMLVHTGLLLRVEDEAELAAVLGHEIAHFLRSHQIKQWRNLRDSAASAVWIDVGLVMFTGIYGLAQMSTVGAALSYNRDQEREADLYGLQLLAASGYDPGAAPRLWTAIAEERALDASKESRNPFFATHPTAEDRQQTLHRAALAYGDHRPDGAAGELRAMLAPHYFAFMRGHLQLQEYEQTEYLLGKHRRLGYPEAQVAFFTGELHRLRKAEGDVDKAIAAYSRALQLPDPPPDAYRELAYLKLKDDAAPEALQLFQRYLAAHPDATDKAMIDYYIESLGTQIHE
ncbi:MAG: M48 family metalloprotease [Pseudomonadota bacterium]|nr:M48 family metalloprotease [Pseudomonadota bacterium]